jgi:hypothetical protein
MQTEHPDPSPPGSRNAWYYAYCPTHGRSIHLSYINGCVECKKMNEKIDQTLQK